MDHDMKLAEMLGGLPSTETEKLASAFKSLSIQELEGILAEGGATSFVSEAAEEISAREKLAAADSWGREMAKDHHKEKMSSVKLAIEMPGVGKMISKGVGHAMGALTSSSGVRRGLIGAGVGAAAGALKNPGQNGSRLSNMAVGAGLGAGAGVAAGHLARAAGSMDNSAGRGLVGAQKNVARQTGNAAAYSAGRDMQSTRVAKGVAKRVARGAAKKATGPAGSMVQTPPKQLPPAQQRLLPAHEPQKLLPAHVPEAPAAAPPAKMANKAVRPITSGVAQATADRNLVHKENGLVGRAKRAVFGGGVKNDALLAAEKRRGQLGLPKTAEIRFDLLAQDMISRSL